MGSNSASGNNKGRRKGHAEFDLFVKATDYIQPIKSDLDMYLEEGVFVCDEDSNYGFNALSWWKQNARKYLALSKMAHEILAIPISTMAFESAFSTGGRVISDDRSSLASMTIETLICTGEWLRNAHKIEKIPNVVCDEFCALHIFELF